MCYFTQDAQWTMASQKNMAPMWVRITATSLRITSESYVMANYKRQYSTLYKLTNTDIAKYVRRDVDANHGYIDPNYNPLPESLMLWANTSSNIQRYCLRLIIHMGKQINSKLWYRDRKKTRYQKIRRYFDENHDFISPYRGKHHMNPSHPS